MRVAPEPLRPRVATKGLGVVVQLMKGQILGRPEKRRIYVTYPDILRKIQEGTTTLSDG